MTDSSSGKIGLRSMVLLGINSIVGTGIFLLPGQVTALTGRWSILAYIFVTLVVLSIAWCFAKCASQFNKNGGSYLYAKEAFGNFVGFEIGLVRWVVGMMTWAALAAGFVTALGALWEPASKEPLRSVLALGIVFGLGFINIFRMGTLKYLNNAATIAKIIPLILFIILGVSYIDHTHFFHSDQLEWQIEGFSGASLIVFYAFSGFENLPVAAAEMQNPRKNIPIAVFSVITICAFLYFLIQLISMGVLGPSLSQSQTPILDSATIIFGTGGKLFVGLAMLISIGGINIAASFITPRSGAALADDGLIPSVVSHRNQHGSPYVAIIVTMVVTGFFVLSGTFAELVAISIVCRFIQYASTCLAVLVLDRKGIVNAFDKTWKLVFPVVGLVGIGWLMMHAPLYQLLWGAGALAVGIPLYILQHKRPILI